MKSTPIRRILVPVDFSACSLAAFEFACGLGVALGASLEVLFVREASDSAPGASALTEEELAAARGELHRFLAKAEPPESLTIVERVASGDARERIVALADEGDFDLIALGTHGRTGRQRMLAGSIAESVVRTSSRAVVTVRGA